eukprot:3121186-Prymnesium_polylepis.1
MRLPYEFQARSPPPTTTRTLVRTAHKPPPAHALPPQLDRDLLALSRRPRGLPLASRPPQHAVRA